MERFFRSLKQENVYLSRYETLKEAKICISSYINTYNTKRLHSAIGHRTPFEVYNQDYANIFDCCMKKEKKTHNINCELGLEWQVG